MSFVLISGNPVDGLRFAGPFDDYDVAVEWATDHLGFGWYIADLDVPEPF